jgi:protein arginine kinase activator
VHGNTQHNGKKAVRQTERLALRERVAGLREELALAIRAEDYERAAALRDEIRALETQVKEDA